MFNIHNNHRNLVITSLAGFLILSTLIAIIPAYQMQENVQPLPNQKDLTPAERKGLAVFISEGCVVCHTQQVRNIQMDDMWGARPSMPSDYYYSKERLSFWQQSPSLLGSERTGPDLTDVGNRRGETWNLIHLYNPRAVEKRSIMPAYPWLFDKVKNPDSNDVVVAVPKAFLSDTTYKIVATTNAMNLVKYLMSLKQVKLPTASAPDFLPSSKLKVKGSVGGNAAKSNALDGEKLYASTCQACHQANGKGLMGAFPPLAGSEIVTGDDVETYIKIILLGYDARAEYGVMPPFAEQLTDEEIAAIANHERSSWGNNAKPIKVETVKKIREMVKSENP